MKIRPAQYSASLFTIALLATSLAACSNHGAPAKAQQKENAAAPLSQASDIGKSFSVILSGLGTAERSNIKIERSALDKEFLLEGNIVPQDGGNIITLASRIVTLHLQNEHLFLMEAPQGHSTDRDLPSAIVLTEFPIVSSSHQDIVFDFNAGMGKIFAVEGFTASNPSGAPAREYETAPNYAIAPLEHGYIAEASINPEKNRLYIRQVGQVAEKTYKGTAKPGAEKTSTVALSQNETRESVEVRYLLSPYHPNANFKPAPVEQDGLVGYFETAPLMNQKTVAEAHSVRWDPEKPIVFAISSNTPKEFHDAVRDGILYWNKVAGREFVKAIDAPAGRRAPDPDYNIVQWVDWDTSGYSYAALQPDPRTGEILHASVFLTSVFAHESDRKVVPFLRTKTKADHKSFGLQGFIGKDLCAYPAASIAEEPAFSDLLGDTTNIKLIDQDSIRATVAHEVGHTLGLRHNFAGSLATNMKLAERDGLATKFFAKRERPRDLVVSSTVMDYNNIFEASIEGYDMADPSAPAETYDRLAIGHLYFGEPVSRDTAPLFCSDEANGEYVDCEDFDLGSSFIEASTYKSATALQQIPGQLVESYLNARFPQPGVAQETLKSWYEEAVHSGGRVNTYLSSQLSILRQLTKGGAILRIRQSYPYVSDVNMDQIRKAELDYVYSEVKRLGGFTKMLPAPPENFVALLDKRLERVLANPNYTQGTGFNYQPYTLTAEDIANIRGYGHGFFVDLEKKMAAQDLKNFLTVLAGKGDDDVVLAHEGDEGLLTVLKARSWKYIFATDGTLPEAEISVPDLTKKPDGSGTYPQKKIKVRLPKFKYSSDIRETATSLLAPKRAESYGWGIKERIALVTEMGRIFHEQFGFGLNNKAGMQQLNADGFPPEVSKWLDEYMGILGGLTGKKPAED